MLLRSLLFLIFFHQIHGDFTPNRNDYDAYGLKIAMNNHFLVQTRNGDQPASFLIQSLPANSTLASSSCLVTFPNSSTNTYVYTIAIGKRQNKTMKNFFLAGELINGQNGTFIGLAQYNPASLTCETSYTFSLQYFTDYVHQEHYILGVEPAGRRAYGFANQFVLLLDSRNISNKQSWNASLIWPDPSFQPYAVDIQDQYGIIAGFVQSIAANLIKYVPIIYLFNFNTSTYRPMIVDEYRPNATPGTWQDLLTNTDANIYGAKYDMSVSIDENGSVLVGMQVINRVFLLSLNQSNPDRLNYISRFTNGRSLGYGKTVAWLDNGIGAILANIYSLNYQWSSSEIHFYDIQSHSYNSNSTPLSIFPNNYQFLPSRMSSTFLSLISSPSSLALMDIQGNLLIFNPSQPGFYSTIQDQGSMPYFTASQSCPPGTYKAQVGIYTCLLCPTGTKNPGNTSQQCLLCLNGSYCPLGSVADVSRSVLRTTVQVKAYPQSPETTIFDEILIQNMFSIGPAHCLVVSPLFWTLIVAGIALLVITTMGLLKVFIANPSDRKVRHRLKCILKHMDLIGEGELWIGGLASFAVVVLVSFAYAFSDNYYRQYPIETTTDSTFACDPHLRNAKFQTTTQSLAIPFANTEQEIVDLLTTQDFILNIDFINTLINCDAASIQALFGTKWSVIRWSSCTNNNAILSISIPLPYQHLSVEVTLDDPKTIGAVRLGLYGKKHQSDHFHLKEMNFNQSFFKDGQVLAQNLPIQLTMTKVINQTTPMIGEESDFTGLYIPTFTVDINSLFFSNDLYVHSTSTLTTLTLILTETPYYVKNIQQPIAKHSEIIFHNLLFTIVCLEIFGLIFLLYKLIIKPILRTIFPKSSNKTKEQSSLSTRNDDVSLTDITANNQLSSKF